ncbi:DUF5979 domain-containing protein [Paeniglutamicibacter sp. R2-26]|uniref:DUF5979 domain-containing protein n=1 Tax=Paeniglutamicibacter sp. R2-26 TaxID=3144417 RepID=UPI003EE45D95
MATALVMTGAGVLPASAQSIADESPATAEASPSSEPAEETPAEETPASEAPASGTEEAPASESPAPSTEKGSQPSAEPTTEASETPQPSPKKQAKSVAPNADELPPSKILVTKNNNLNGNPVQPGDTFTYTLTITCSSLTTDCVGATLVDVLPEEFDVTMLPKSTNDYDVIYDEATRELRVVFKKPLQNPAGTTGLTAGSTVTIEVGMRLPDDTDETDGTIVPNHVTGTSDNTEDSTDDSNVEIDIPAVVKPVATKDWPGSAVAGMDEKSTITLGVSNGSSNTAEVDELVLSETDEDVFNYFNFDGATVTSFPEGADTAVFRVQLADGTWVEANTLTGPGDLVLPPGVDPEDVVGVETTFSDSSGAVLPSSKTAGTVEIDVVARNFEREGGAEILPDKTITVNNCVQVAAGDKTQGEVAGKDACDDYSIFPNTLILDAQKKFYADSNGNFQTDNGEHAVIGQDSGVSIGLSVTNASDFPVKEIVIYEPGDPASGPSEFDKFDASKFKVTYPEGATSGTVVATMSDGTTRTFDVVDGEVVDLPSDPRVESLKLTFTGVDADGNPSIAPGATAGFDIHGNLNDKANEDDLSGGSSPQIQNCAHFTGDAGRTNGTGTAANDACQSLELEGVDGQGTGSKDVGQISVPEGQPIPFNLNFTNNGNVPLNGVTITDPRFEADGTPMDPNPFDQLRITSASVSGVTDGAVIELFIPGTPVPGTWVPYEGASAGELEAARGIRATLPGALLPTQGFNLHLVTERREGVEDGVEILNCFDAVGTDPDAGQVPVSNKCSPAITTGPVDGGAGMDKVIEPKLLPEFIPGMEDPTASVKLMISNEGNLSAKRLVVEDHDEDFFNAFDFNGFTGLKFPVGADRVQIDAYAGGAWVTGNPATVAELPAGVANDQVRGIRATFSSTNTANNGFVLTPCGSLEDGQTGGNCHGEVVFSVKLLPELRVPDAGGSSTVGVHENTLEGGYQTIVQGPDGIEEIPPTTEDVEVVPGESSLNVQKTPDSTVSPGQTAPFVLKVTNTGDTNLEHVEVVDRLDEHMQLNEQFSGDGIAGHPYKLTFGNLPDGAAGPPQPEYSVQRDGDGKVTEITWDFGDDWVLPPNAWVALEIEVKLAPGVVAGEVVPNTVGSTVDNEDFTCTDPTGLNPGTSEEWDGEQYCTDSAELKTSAGAAFDSRKWVAGNPDLGWYNTVTGKPVPVGDATCPRTTDAQGVAYTEYPCIALVNPGDNYKYMLRVVNAGTEPAKQMRLIDQLPVEGDTGVYLDEDRGTEWNNRPVLASEPRLTYKSVGGTSSGTLTNLYTDEPSYDTVCTKDLDMAPGAEQCAPGDWDDSFSAQVTAAQFRIAFEEAMLPGDTVQVNFEMKAPLTVRVVNSPTIAWNSFAHAETTERSDGTEHVMTPSEPIKVGVGLSYGNLELKKSIGENPGNLPLAEKDFQFQVTCTIMPVGASGPTTVLDEVFDVSASSPEHIEGLPAGASCEIYEVDSAGGTSSATQDDPVVVVIESSLGEDGDDEPVYQTATITNDFPLSGLAIGKKVDGDAADFAPTDFEVSVTCTFDGQPLPDFTGKTVTVTAGERTSVTGIPVGASCVVSETDSHGATGITWDPAGESANTSAPLVIGKDTEVDVSVTNTFNGGTLSIRKGTVGSGADEEFATGPFEFQLVCTYEGKQLDLGDDATISLGGDASAEDLGSYVVGPLPAGTECTVTETDNGGADGTPDPVTVTIVEGEHTVAGFVGQDANVFSSGTVSLTKDLAGAAAGEDWATDARFKVRVTCQVQLQDGGSDPVLADIYSKVVTIKGGESITLSEPDLDGNEVPVELPVGAHCFGEEIVTGGATGHSVDFDSYGNAVVVTAQEDPDTVQELTISATNTFEYGALNVSKVVDGAAAGYIGDREFTVELTCSLPNGTDTPTTLEPRTLTISGGETVTVDKLPVGAECFATETETGGADDVEVSHDDASDPAIVTADAETPVEITAVNTFDAGQLTVKKTVVDGDAGPYEFSLTCTTDFGPVELDGDDANFSLQDGEEKVVSVPAGAECEVEELDSKGAEVSFVEADGSDDGQATVDGDVWIEVVNTFDKPVEPGDGDEDGNGNGNGNEDGSGDGLASTGFQALGLAVAGLLALGAGIFLVRRRRTS